LRTPHVKHPLTPWGSRLDSRQFVKRPCGFVTGSLSSIVNAAPASRESS
jgi:hypothetical protein